MDILNFTSIEPGKLKEMLLNGSLCNPGDIIHTCDTDVLAPLNPRSINCSFRNNRPYWTPGDLIQSVQAIRSAGFKNVVIDVNFPWAVDIAEELARDCIVSKVFSGNITNGVEKPPEDTAQLEIQEGSLVKLRSGSPAFIVVGLNRDMATLAHYSEAQGKIVITKGVNIKFLLLTK